MSIRSLAFEGIIPRIKSETKATSSSRRVRRPTIISSQVLVNRSKVRARAVGQGFLLLPWLGLMASTAVVVISVAYLFSINMYAARGYDLKKQQALVRELTIKQQQLIIKQAEIGSIAQLNSAATAEQLVQITDEEFLQPKQLTSR